MAVPSLACELLATIPKHLNASASMQHVGPANQGSHNTKLTLFLTPCGMVPAGFLQLSSLAKLTNLAMPESGATLVWELVAALFSLHRVEFELSHASPGEPDDSDTALAAFGAQTHLQQLHLHASCGDLPAALQLPPRLTVRTQHLDPPDLEVARAASIRWTQFCLIKYV